MKVKDYLDQLYQQTFFMGEKEASSLKYNIKWYRDTAKWRGYLFRTLGGFALVLSISLPFV